MPSVRDDPLLYRFGFVCVFADEVPTGEGWGKLRSAWRSVKTDEFTVFSHPEVPVVPVSGSSVLIGHAFAAGAERPAQELLEAALAAGSDSALHEALDLLCGRFALVTSRWGGRVYHDAIGSRSVFYRSGEPPCIASHDGLLGGLLGLKTDPLSEEISRQSEYVGRRVTYLPGDLSVYSGVRALIPNNYYDVRAERSVRYWPRVPRRETTLEEFHLLADEYFDGFAQYVSGRFTPVLGVTAGVDSRALIAALRSRNVPMEYATWTMSPTDASVVEDMSSYLKGRHVFLPEAGQQSTEEFYRVCDVVRRNMGHYNAGMETPAYVRQTFGEGRVFVRGYGGEVMRGFYRTYGTPLSEGSPVEDLLRAYALGMKKPLSERLVGLVREALEQFMERAGYEGLEDFGYDMNDLYYWESRMGVWGASMHNAMDAAMLSMSGFNNRRLFEGAFGLAPEERLTNRLLLDLTQRYDRELARFPVNPSKKPESPASGKGGEALTTKERLRERLEAQQANIDALRARLQAREAELKEIKQSRLWRFSEPLRRALGAVRYRRSDN